MLLKILSLGTIKLLFLCGCLTAFPSQMSDGEISVSYNSKSAFPHFPTQIHIFKVQKEAIVKPSNIRKKRSTNKKRPPTDPVWKRKWLFLDKQTSIQKK